MVASQLHHATINPSRTTDVNNRHSKGVQSIGRTAKPPDVMKIQVRSILAGGLILSLAWAAGCTSKSKEPRVYHHSPTPPAPPADLTKFEPTAPPPAPAPVASPEENTTPEAPPTEAPTAPAPVVDVTTTELAPDVAGVVEMAKRGVGSEALLAYVETNPISTKLTPESIVYLNDLGVPENVVATMIRQGDAGNPAPAPSPAPKDVTQGAPVASTPAPPAQTQPTPPPSAPPANDNYFHRSLAPYGDWIYDGRHGWVWRPTVAAVDTGWRPYCHGGRWIYSDVGWYWHSTYSWGWAPFHYGRWHRSSIHGWYWVPGYRWSPAWVHWRSSDIYCGWAPLPPGCDYVTGVGYMWHGSRVSVGFHFGLSHHHYTYCDYAYLRHRRLHRHRIRDNDISVVHNETKVVNNHITENNTTIINNGISPELLAEKTREPVRKVRIREVDLELESIKKVGQIDENGKTLAVYRPEVPTPPDAGPGEKPFTRQQVSKSATPDTTEGEKPTNNNDDDSNDKNGNGRRVAKKHSEPKLEKPGKLNISGSGSIRTPRPFGRSGVAGAQTSPGTTASTSRSTSPAATKPSRPSRIGTSGRSPSRVAAAKSSNNRSTTIRRTPVTSSRTSRPTVPIKPSAIGRTPSFKRYTPRVTVRKPVRTYGGTQRLTNPSTPRQRVGGVGRTRPSSPSYARPSTPSRPTTPAPSRSFGTSRSFKPSAPSFRSPSRSSAPSYKAPSRSYSPPARSYSPPSRSYSPPTRSTPPSRSYSPPSRSSSPPSPPSRSSSPPSSPPSSSSGPPQRDPL